MCKVICKTDFQACLIWAPPIKIHFISFQRRVVDAFTVIRFPGRRCTHLDGQVLTALINLGLGGCLGVVCGKGVRCEHIPYKIYV